MAKVTKQTFLVPLVVERELKVKLRRSFLSRLASEVRKELREEATEKNFPGDFANSFRVKYLPNGIALESEHPAVIFMDKGRKAAQMKWLEGKTIPLLDDQGNLIFRTVTRESLIDGGWVRPEVEPLNFMDVVDRVLEKPSIYGLFVREMTRAISEAVGIQLHQAAKSAYEKGK